MSDSRKYIATVEGSAKAWVTFNGTGTIAIDESYGVSSLTDDATGKYDINLSVTMSTSKYPTVGSIIGTTSGSFDSFVGGNNLSAKLTTSVGVAALSHTGSNVDVSEVQVIINGGIV